MAAASTEYFVSNVKKQVKLAIPIDVHLWRFTKSVYFTPRFVATISTRINKMRTFIIYYQLTDLI